MPYYPDTISFDTTPESVFDEPSGNWVEGAPITESYPCRAEVSGANGKEKGVDGSRTDFNWEVYIPLPLNAIIEGTPVIITLTREGRTIKETVKRFKKSNYNAHLWL